MRVVPFQKQSAFMGRPPLSWASAEIAFTIDAPENPA